MNQPESPASLKSESFAGIAWRTLFTAFSFTLFGLGALVLSIVVLPVIHLISHGRLLAQRRSRATVRRALRLFIWFMRGSGVLDHEITGLRQVEPGSLIVANHPSLIDAVFIIAYLPDTYCVVKEALGRNPFTRLTLLATGYVTSNNPNLMIERCVRLLGEGGRILLFPEGTRTVRGKPPEFKRGAANLIARARCPTTPIFLSIEPPTLSKGEPWLKVPASKVQYSMTIGASIPPERLLDNTSTERMNARRCNARLQAIFSDQLSNIMGENLGIDEFDEFDGKATDRHQSADRHYSGT